MNFDIFILESYLDAAPEIFAYILEFMMSSIDANIPPSKASLIHLPNILTPGTYRDACLFVCFVFNLF